MSAIPSNANRGPMMVKALWSMDAIAGIIVFLRILTAIMIHKKFGLADALMVVAWICGVTNNALITVSAHYGLGRHIAWLEVHTPQTIALAMKFNVIPQPIGIMCPTLARVSFAMFMLKLVRSKSWMNYTLHICIWANVGVNIINAVLIFPQCQHVESIWDSRVKGWCWPKHVQTDLGYWQGAINTLVDITMTVIPAMLVWNLQMKPRLKWGIFALLSLSVFGAVSSIVKTVELKSLGERGDITWNLVPFVIWFTIENNVVIIAATVPTIRPLFRRRTKSSSVGAYPSSSRTADIKSNTYGMHSYGSDPCSRGYIRSNARAEALTGGNFDPTSHFGDCIMKSTSIYVHSREAGTERGASAESSDNRSFVGRTRRPDEEDRESQIEFARAV